MNKHFDSFASGDLVVSTAALVIIKGTIGTCSIITNDNCYFINKEGSMFISKFKNVDVENQLLIFENGTFDVKSLIFIGRDDA